MKYQTPRPERAVQQCCIRTTCGVKNTYRLLRSLDAVHGTDLYSLFLTTETESTVDEEFLLDLARTEADAISFFEHMLAMSVTACTLIDVASDLLAENFTKQI